MIHRKDTFFLGIFILMLSSSFLGLPSFWKTSLFFLSGLILMAISVKINFSKKSHKRLHRKEKALPTVIENIPVSPVDNENQPQL